jgi:hypothetical protein
MVLAITLLLVFLCFMGALLSFLLGLKKKKSQIPEHDDLSYSKWAAVEPGPDSYYPIHERERK